MGLEEFMYGLNAFRQPSEPSDFNKIPLINKLRKELLQSRTSRKGKPVSWNVDKDTKRRIKPGKRLIPLAAYTCHSEKPLIDNNDGDVSDSNTINILDKSTLLLIRSLGYSSLRPIGIDKTLKEIEKEKGSKQKKQQNEHNSGQEPRLNAYQTSSSFIVSNDNHQHTEQSVLLTAQVGEQSEEEYDQSYDYDNEYAEVHEQGSMLDRTRGTFVEDSQLIDASYTNRSRSRHSNVDALPYVNENEDSVHEQPSLTISDTLEPGAQGSRVPSLT
ncbi:Mnd2 [Kluyveromyces lactis]|nr:Mnd2 [Kluyveromyces lactis]